MGDLEWLSNFFRNYFFNPENLKLPKKRRIWEVFILTKLKDQKKTLRKIQNIAAFL